MKAIRMRSKELYGEGIGFNWLLKYVDLWLSRLVRTHNTNFSNSNESLNPIPDKDHKRFTNPLKVEKSPPKVNIASVIGSIEDKAKAILDTVGHYFDQDSPDFDIEPF
jgi:hypothetical protein